MTARLSVTLLMLAQVLACPFLGCGECRGACAAQPLIAEQAGDCCCQGKPSSQKSDSVPCHDPQCPESPGPLNCLCGGAVQANAVECPDLLGGGELLDLPGAELSHAAAVLAAASGEFPMESSPHFPPLKTGTSVCALTQNFLL